MRLLHSASVYMARSDQEVEPGMAKEVFEMRTIKEIKDALDRCISDDKPCTTGADINVPTNGGEKDGHDQ